MRHTFVPLHHNEEVRIQGARQAVQEIVLKGALINLEKTGNTDTVVRKGKKAADQHCLFWRLESERGVSLNAHYSLLIKRIYYTFF